jgi:hypothetical protein
MFKILFGAIGMFVLMTVFLDTSVKVLSISNSIFTEAKVVYKVSKEVLAKPEVQEKLDSISTEIKKASK